MTVKVTKKRMLSAKGNKAAQRAGRKATKTAQRAGRKATKREKAAKTRAAEEREENAGNAEGGSKKGETRKRAYT